MDVILTGATSSSTQYLDIILQPVYALYAPMQVKLSAARLLGQTLKI